MRRRPLIAAVVTIALGLATRPLAKVAPALADPLGDALYTLLLFWLARLAAPRLSVARAALIAFALSAAVECSQLWHPAWLDAIRRTTPGRLVLGSGFAALDLLWYALGAAGGAALENLRTVRDTRRV